MARMSATLERIARAAVEKAEKREKEEPSTTKKRANSSSHHKRRRPTTLRTAMTPDSTKPNIPTTDQTTMNGNSDMNTNTDIGIPDAIEGLPPINSSGYVVPLSPDTKTQPEPQPQPTNSYTPEYLDRTFLYEAGAREAAYTNPPIPIPSWQLSQDFSNTPLQPGQLPGPTLTNLETQSPSSFASSTPTGTTPGFPEFFQVPMAGDWDYSGTLFAGLFPTENGYPVGGGAQVAGGAGGGSMDPSMSTLSAESYMHGAPAVEGEFDANGLGYGFIPEGQRQGQGQGQGQAEDMVWPNGFLGLF
jgi:hypothetical protein